MLNTVTINVCEINYIDLDTRKKYGYAYAITIEDKWDRFFVRVPANKIDNRELPGNSIEKVLRILLSLYSDLPIIIRENLKSKGSFIVNNEIYHYEQVSKIVNKLQPQPMLV